MTAETPAQVTSPAPTVSLRVGTDVQPVAEVAASLIRFGPRYSRRLFTEHELDSCPGEPAAAADGLAARFAAKEAVLKVLRPRDIVPAWTSIEVRRMPGGWPEIVLRDRAAELAERAGVIDLAVSLSHAGGIATATVVAQLAVAAPAVARQVAAPATAAPQKGERAHDDVS